MSEPSILDPPIGRQTTSEGWITGDHGLALLPPTWSETRSDFPFVSAGIRSPPLIGSAFAGQERSDPGIVAATARPDDAIRGLNTPVVAREFLLLSPGLLRAQEYLRRDPS